jgi:hypothetical protein
LPESPIALHARPTDPADLKGDREHLLPLRARSGRSELGACRTGSPRTGAARATRRRAGFLLSEFFDADPADVTPAIVERGPGRRDGAVSTTSLTDLTMALLLAAIEGRNLDRAVDSMELDGFVVEGPLHGPWLTRLPDALRDALAAASDEELRFYARRWLCAVELSHASLTAMTKVLDDLAVLARSAQARSNAMYLWTSL